MFKVIHKETGKTVTVYGLSGVSFLLWDEENECWWHDNINNYKPLPDFATAMKTLQTICGGSVEDQNDHKKGD